MINLLSKTRFNTTPRSLAGAFFKAALVSTPLFFVAAPAEAASITVKSTVNGFTGQFAPVNWTITGNTNGNVVTWQPNAGNPASIRMVRGAGVVASPQISRALNPALFEALRPSFATGPLVGYSYSFNWNWSFNNTGTGGTTSTNSTFAFKPLPLPSTALNTGSPTSGTWSDGSPDNSLGAIIERTQSGRQGTGIATLSNFQFVAEYEVPGPLPVLGAAAAFAWSRKLRNRLKVSTELS